MLQSVFHIFQVSTLCVTIISRIKLVYSGYCTFFIRNPDPNNIVHPKNHLFSACIFASICYCSFVRNISRYANCSNVPRLYRPICLKNWYVHTLFHFLTMPYFVLSSLAVNTIFTVFVLNRFYACQMICVK